MVAREFQSYTSKRSVNFVNAVDVVDAAEQPRRRGTRRSEAKQTHCRGEFRVVAIQWKLSKMPPPPGRRVAAPENPLRWRISLCLTQIKRINLYALQVIKITLIICLHKMDTDREKNCNVYSIQIGINIQQITNHSIITWIIRKLWNARQKNKRDERDVRKIKHLDCRGTEICRERAAVNYIYQEGNYA